MGHTYRGPKSGCKMVTLFGGYSYDGVIAGIWVLHTGAISGCKLQTLFGGYSFDGVIASIWVIDTGGRSGCKKIPLFDSDSDNGISSPSLLNEYLWYDKHWGPSQRVVTLFYLHRNPCQFIVLPCHSLRQSQSQHVQTFVKVAIVRVVTCICQSSYIYLTELLWISF